MKPRSTPKPAKVAAKTAAPKKATGAKAPVIAPVATDAAAAVEGEVIEGDAASAPLVAPVAVGAPADAPPAPAFVAIGDDTTPLLPLDQKPMTEKELVVEYQRVGRDIAKLQNDRGTDKVLDLWPTFKALKLAEMCKTIEGRLNLEGTLKQLRTHIERRRGITISSECLNNPLAAQCQ